MDNPEKLAFANYHRRFGVEIEVNALDSRDFIAYPLGTNELPKGIDYIGELLSSFLREPVDIQTWHYTHDNNNWVLKSDRSCGIELCSPVSNRRYGLNNICDVLDLINRDPQIPIDSRCSLHIHVNVADCTTEETAAILTYWIKSEPVFIDFLPSYRKKSRYFQCVGASDLVPHNFRNYEMLSRLMGVHKYMTINTYHKNKNHRNTIEFRIMGYDGCRYVQHAKNWIILIMHFVEMAKKRPLPEFYREGDPWSGLSWFNPREVMELLGFMGDYELSQELLDVRHWFLSCLKMWTGKGTGFWGMESRGKAAQQVHEIIAELGLKV